MKSDQLKTYITLFSEGDENAFYKIVDGYKDEIFNLCYRILNDYDDADDVAQEVFIRMYKSVVKFQFQSSFSTWLYRISVNCCYSYIKKNRKSNVSALPDSFEIADERNGDSYYSDLVREALTKLEAKQRTLIVLRDIKGLSYEEIAEILKVSIGTVKSRLNRAREKLREILRRLL